MWPVLNRVAQAEVVMVDLDLAPSRPQELGGGEHDRGVPAAASNFLRPGIRGHVEGVKCVVGRVKVGDDLTERSVRTALDL